MCDASKGVTFDQPQCYSNISKILGCSWGFAVIFSFNPLLKKSIFLYQKSISKYDLIILTPEQPSSKSQKPIKHTPHKY